jgi:nifR3 family TIM-barrel protein
MQILQKPIYLRNLKIDPPLVLAPMVALSHSALRQLIAGFGGAGLLSTEMLSAKRLPTESSALSPYLVRTASEKPLSYQLLTSRASEVAPAIDALHRLGADAVDLNLGCPAPAVRKFGAGMMLMEQPEDVRRIVAEARKRTALPLSAKIRLSIEDEQKLRDFCIMLQDEGIDMLSVHARFNKESFARNPRWEWVGKVKGWLKIPVIANGGIFSVQDAEKCLRVSGADGLMLARGAVIKPWLFAEIARAVYGYAVPESFLSLPVLYRSFMDLLNEHFLPEHRLTRLKQFTLYFAENYKFGHHLKSSVHCSDSIDQARERAEIFFSENQ